MKQFGDHTGICVLLVPTLFVAACKAAPPVEACIVETGRVGPLTIGMQLNPSELRASSYIVEEIPVPEGHARQWRIESSAGDATSWKLLASVDGSSRIFLIDTAAGCRTAKGMSTGDQLSALLNTYKLAAVDVYDDGYYVFFSDLPGVGFRLSFGDVPKELRQRSDDELSEQEMRALLELGQARIDSIRVVWSGS